MGRIVAAVTCDIVRSQRYSTELRKTMDTLLKNTVDVILVDLKMPVMGGEEFLKRARPLFPEIPIIVLTGHGTMELAVECMKHGAYDFITKPIEFDNLLLTIDRAMEKRRLEQKSRRFQDDIVRGHLELSTEKKRLETIAQLTTA